MSTPKPNEPESEFWAKVESGIEELGEPFPGARCNHLSPSGEVCGKIALSSGPGDRLRCIRHISEEFQNPQTVNTLVQ